MLVTFVVLRVKTLKETNLGALIVCKESHVQ